MVWVKEKGKVPAREFRVAREIRRFEFLPRPTRGLLGKKLVRPKHASAV